MNLCCQVCQTAIPPSAINEREQTATCPSCCALLYFPNKDKPRTKPTSHRPDFWIVDRSKDSLTFTHRWRDDRSRLIVMTIFTAFWNSIFWFHLAWDDRGRFDYFMLPFIIAGVALVYATICQYANTTTIHVNRYALVCHHRPIPLKTERSIPVPNIRQLYCKEIEHRRRNTTTVDYTLYILDNMHREIALMNSIENADLAFFLEREIEDFLEIKDQPIAGEYRG